jgi:hypothetical protein
MDGQRPQDGHDVRAGQDDELLLERLAAVAARTDPVPARVREAAEACLTWRRADAELAELLFDSAADDERLAGVRGRSDARLVTFGDPAAVAVELEVVEAAGTRHLIGQLIPPRPATVEIRNPQGTVTVHADELGVFRADRLSAGPTSLRCVSGGRAGRAIETAWTLL